MSEFGPGPRVKICGLTRAVDARHAAGAGADFLGVVLTAGYGRSVRPEQATSVLAGTTATRVAVLVDEAPDRSAELASSIEAGVLQLHGSEDRATVEALRRLGAWKLWTAVRARTIDDVVRAVDDVGDLVDGVLVEGWREGAVGGAGATVGLDPEAVRRSVPERLLFILAGGLTPDSVASAVARFSPDVVDVSSGVERTAGAKDRRLIEAFIDSSRL